MPATFGEVNDDPPSIGFDDLCSASNNAAMRPLVLTGTIRQILVGHFNDSSQIEDVDLKGSVWHRLISESKIKISTVHKWKPEDADRVPAIYLKRNSMKRLSIYHNDVVDNSPEFDRKFAALWVGSHTLFCLGGTSAQAEVLAHEVSSLLSEFASPVRDSLGLHRFRVTDVGAAGKLKGYDKNFVIPVTLSWAYQQAWVLRQHARPLQTLQVEFIFDC